MQTSYFILVLVVIVSAVIQVSDGFGFSGDSVQCKGTTVKGDPKMKEKYTKCNTTVYEGYTKRKETPDGFGPMLCTGLCVMMEDNLVNKTTGLPNKAGLDNYKDMFDAIPEAVRAGMKDAFYKCYEQHKKDVMYNPKKPTDCAGITGVGLCIKTKIDALCNPDPPAEDE